MNGLRSADPIPSGPFTTGLRESDRLLVASFYSPDVCWRFQRSLSAAGVRFTASSAGGGKTKIEVAFGDREAAWRLLAEQERAYPDERPSIVRGAYDFTLFGSSMGALAGVASPAVSRVVVVWAVVWAGLVATGALLGFMADRFCRRSRYRGHFQFDLFDCLLLMTVVALLVVSWTYLLQSIPRK